MNREDVRALQNVIDIMKGNIEEKLADIPDLVLFRLDRRIEEVFAEINDPETDIVEFDIVDFAQKCKTLLQSCDERYHALLAIGEEVQQELDKLVAVINDLDDISVFREKYKALRYESAPPVKKDENGD